MKSTAPITIEDEVYEAVVHFETVQTVM